MVEPQSAFLIAQYPGPTPNFETPQEWFLYISFILLMVSVLALVSKMFNVHILTKKPEDLSWELWVFPALTFAFGLLGLFWG